MQLRNKIKAALHKRHKVSYDVPLSVGQGDTVTCA